MRYLTTLLFFLFLCAPVTVQDTYKPQPKPKRETKLKSVEKKKPVIKGYVPYPGFVLDSTLGEWLDTVKRVYKLWE